MYHSYLQALYWWWSLQSQLQVCLLKVWRGPQVFCRSRQEQEHLESPITSTSAQTFWQRPVPSPHLETITGTFLLTWAVETQLW